MPVIFGTSLAVVMGGARLDVLAFLVALLAMMILHSAANMLSDVFDFRRGLDTDVTPVSGAIVRGWLSRAGAAGSIFLFVVGSPRACPGHDDGAGLCWIGAAGVAVGASYTFLKSRALGDLAVFLDFGILGSLGAWVVQTALLLASDGLDGSHGHARHRHPPCQQLAGLVSDSGLKVYTMAYRLGDRGSLVYYGVLLFGSMGLIIAFVVVPRVAPCPFRRFRPPSSSSSPPFPGPSFFGSGPCGGMRPRSRWISSSSTARRPLII